MVENFYLFKWWWNTCRWSFNYFWWYNWYNKKLRRTWRFTSNYYNGDISIVSSDDGINSTATSGQGIVIGGGNLYILAGGDGLDSNSRTAYSGIVFKGGKTVVISTSGGNSAIDTEAGYTYTSGSVLAIMPNGGMTSEATHCSNFSSVAKKISMSLSSGKTLTVSVSNSAILSVKIPCNLSAIVIYLGSTSANISLN